MDNEYELNLPKSAKVIFGGIYENMDRYEEDILYIKLDSGFELDVGCYGSEKYNKWKDGDNTHPFTVIVIVDDGFYNWTNPIERIDIVDEKELVDKISELAFDYSIGGFKYEYYLIN